MAEEKKTLEDLKAMTSGAAAEAPRAAEPKIDALGRAYATGKRKDAVARVWIRPGSGKITVNGRDQETYFARATLRMLVNQPFAVTKREGQYDVICTVKGGGLSGQAGAVRHGVLAAAGGIGSAERVALGLALRRLRRDGAGGNREVLEVGERAAAGLAHVRPSGSWG